MADPWVMNTQMWFNDTYGNDLGTQTLVVDGQPGWATMFALTRALQHELDLTSLADNFGASTLAAVTAFGDITASNPNPADPPSNIVKIAQGALYCKGYNADNGGLSGRWNSTTQLAMANLRADMGLTGTGILTPKIFKSLLTMDATRLIAGGDAVIQQGQRALNARYLSRRDFYAVPTDGYFLRDTHRALLFALQYELGLEDGVANGNFGPTTKTRLAQQGNLTVGSTDSTRYFVRLFHFALRANKYEVNFTGTFTSGTAAAVNSFQQYVKLPVTGSANLQTWASLLISTGDPDRPGTGADCISTLTSERLSTLRNAGYQYFGRYLTNTPDYGLDKSIKTGELERIFSAGGRVFPIFQTGGGQIAHFTNLRGKEVGEEAANAAWAYGFPSNTIIYFSVDFDALPYQVTDSVIPYFQGIPERFNRTSRNYRIGVYGPRDVCKQIIDAGLAVSSFVSDMSTGYAGNLGQPLPPNWAFDQIQTLTIGSGAGAVEIDKNVVSGSDLGVSTVVPTIATGNDPQIPATQFDAFEDDWWRECFEHDDSAWQQYWMPLNRDNVKARVAFHDPFITQLAAELGCHKALIMTPLIWEGMVIRAEDDAADLRVSAYYAGMETVGSPPPGTADDSSTGVCQIFARTAIRGNNWAIDKGLINTRRFDPINWRDVRDMWLTLKNNEQENIRLATFVMMMEASDGPGGVPLNQLRQMTPSQVIAACHGYNNSWFDTGGPTTDSMKYGRNRMQLYFTIQRWHQSF